MRKIFEFDKNKKTTLRLLPSFTTFSVSKRKYWTKQGIRKRKIINIFN